MLDMHEANIQGVLFDYSSLGCLAATLFDVIFLVCPYVFMISADADSPSGKVVLEAAWACTEYDTDEDPATEDPDVPTFTPASWDLPAAIIGAGKPSTRAPLQLRETLARLTAGASATGTSRRTTDGKVSPASFGRSRPIGLRTPLSAISLSARSLLVSLTI